MNGIGSMPSYFQAMADDFQLVFMLSVPIAIVLFYLSWRGLRGDHRAWALSKNARRFGPFMGMNNNYPFKTAAGGLFAALLAVGSVATGNPAVALAATPMPGPLAAICIVSGFVAGHWWPAFLGPRWYRQWRAACRTANHSPGQSRWALPYTDSEISAINALPDDNPRKPPLLRDLELCRRNLAPRQAWDDARQQERDIRDHCRKARRGEIP